MGINNPTPDPTAILDVSSNDKGVLIPRMSGAERVAIGGGSPATGLLVFDNDSKSFWYWNATSWTELGSNTDWVETPTTVSTTKSVGIGTSSPDGPLEIEGAGNQYMRATTTNSFNTGIEFIMQGAGGDWRFTNDNDFLDLEFSNDDFATSSRRATWRNSNGESRLGIGTASPSEQLHVIGTIKSSDLSGIGTRPVMANSSGNLIPGPEPVTQYYSAGPSSFTSGHSSFTLNSYAYNTTSTTKIFAPVDLPDGATVNSVRIYYNDNSSSNNLEFSLFRRDIDLPNSIGTTMAHGFSSGTPGFTSFIDSGITNPVIDNSSYFYEINVQPAVNNQWSGNLISAKSVLITYSLP